MQVLKSVDLRAVGEDLTVASVTREFLEKASMIAQLKNEIDESKVEDKEKIAGVMVKIKQLEGEIN